MFGLEDKDLFHKLGGLCSRKLHEFNYMNSGYGHTAMYSQQSDEYIQAMLFEK